ncbi:hypothetical protein JTB14_032990 [Gonioctena quinquepunctata]|nr:hypothetical protein JTB14_032990 [Gonioctena quinquepunctata]
MFTFSKDAKKAWDNFAAAFQDSGLTRRVGLLRTLITVTLEKSSSVEDYVNTIITTAHKLSAIGLTVSDEWIGTILLAGLPESYKPMIMGIEISGVKVTADSIKTKLLQDISVVTGSDKKSVAMYGASSSKFKGKNKMSSESYCNMSKSVRCYNCNQYGHFASQCNKKRDNKFKNRSGKNSALFSAFSLHNKNNAWYLDSGCPAHMTASCEILQDKRKSTKLTITTANNEEMSTDIMGNIKLPLSVERESSDVTINDVYFVPQLKVNLLSVSQIVSKGHTVVFKSDGAKVYNSSKEIKASATHVRNLFELDLAPINTCGSAMISVSSEKGCELWHRRLAHVNSSSLNKLKSGLVYGIDFPNNFLSDLTCEVCIMEKKSPFAI